MPNSAADIFNALEGTWQIARTITPGGRFAGQGAFNMVSDDELAYEESGELTLDSGQVIEAGRRFIYRLEGGVIAVYFDDGESKGQLFHRLEFKRNMATGNHWCKDDYYEAQYSFNLPSDFEITYKVKGPKKDYVSASVFTLLRT